MIGLHRRRTGGHAADSRSWVGHKADVGTQALFFEGPICHPRVLYTLSDNSSG